jgi:hypothetical protein
VDQRAARARSIQHAIGRILLEDWNPIRVPGGVPPDEYDAYIGGVYRLLSSGAGPEELAAHLGMIERDAMGLAATTASAAANLAVARKLCGLNVRLEDPITPPNVC